MIHSFEQIAIQLYFSRLTNVQSIATGHARTINRMSQRIPKMGFLDAILMVVCGIMNTFKAKDDSQVRSELAGYLK